RALVEHPDVPAISFTGGTATGADIARRAAPEFKRLSLELGGKNPTVVFADCNFDEALAGALRAAFSNQGEICLCGSRILVERPIYERFRNGFTAGAKKLKVGDPRDAATEVGALVSREHYEKVLGCIALAREEGGSILCGGEALKLPGRLAGGWFISPTVIEGLDGGCRTNQEEIFGPVATLIPFDGEDEALAIANDVRYGLAASLWTENLGKALRVSERLQAGLIWVNCWMLRDLRTPMGGVKDSGVGHEGGFESMRFFTDTRNVCLKY
ncbi:MAG: aldehyde dehydrogenase family protein, partial [Gammaproteobacteria bacterium]